MFTTNLKSAVGSRETIIWQGKPQKKCFIFESIFNPMLPFALIWGIFDFGIIGTFAVAGTKGEVEGPVGLGVFLIGFFALHLMPVWIYLGGILLTARRYRNTEYIITDRGVYISGGAFSYSYEMKPFTELSHISMHRGIFDQMLGVGDVEMSTAHADFVYNNNRNSANLKKFTICDIPDYQKVYQIVKDMQTDIYSDTMYPNELRPEENRGYNTRYSGTDQFRNY